MPAQVQNLSAAGLYLTTEVVPTLGTPVRCRFRLGHTPRELFGRVAWVSRARADGSVEGFETAGAGIEFTDLTQDDQTLLADVLQQISQSGPHTTNSQENLSVWFEGLSSPVRTQGQVSSEEIVVTTLLPFLRIGSDVKVGMTGGEGIRYRYARIEGLALDSLQPDEPPRIVVTMRATDAVPKEAGELSSAMRSRGEAFSESKPVRTRRTSDMAAYPLPPLSAAHSALTPSPQLLGQTGMGAPSASRPRVPTPPPIPRSVTPPPLPRAPTPPPVPLPRSLTPPPQTASPSGSHGLAVQGPFSLAPSGRVPLASGPTPAPTIYPDTAPRSRTFQQTRFAWVAGAVITAVALVAFAGRSLWLTKPTADIDVGVETIAVRVPPVPRVAQVPSPVAQVPTSRAPALEIPVDVRQKPSAPASTRPSPAVTPPAGSKGAQRPPATPAAAAPAADEAAQAIATVQAEEGQSPTPPSALPSSDEVLSVTAEAATPAPVATPTPDVPDDEAAVATADTNAAPAAASSTAIPPPPQYARAPFSFAQEADATVVVVPLMGISKPTEVLALAPQPGVVVILAKAKLPRREAMYSVKHPVISFVSLETRPLGVYVRVLFGPRGASYKITNRLGELRIAVKHKP